MLYSGIDLHKRSVVIATVDERGHVVREESVPASRAAVARYFRRLPEPTVATVEATSSWYWIRDLLEHERVPLTLAHAKFVKAIAYAKVKTDAVDALTLDWTGMWAYADGNTCSGDTQAEIPSVPTGPSGPLVAQTKLVPRPAQPISRPSATVTGPAGPDQPIPGSSVAPTYHKFNLHVWRLSGKLSDSVAFRQKLPLALPNCKNPQLSLFMNQSGENSLCGVVSGKLILSIPLSRK